MNQKIKVQFWGDLICPMCPIGYVNLKQAIELFPEKENVELVYRSFRLRPGVAPHSVDEYLKKKDGKSVNVAAILTQVEQWGASAGLTYKMAKTQAGDTMDAHRIVHFANSKGLQLQAVERFQKAHFAEEENIFDRTTLVRLAGDIGLVRDAVTAMLEGNDFKDEVAADQTGLQQLGFSGIPFFLVDGEIPIRGIQTPDVFLEAFNIAWESKKQLVTEDVTGMACGTDSCAF